MGTDDLGRAAQGGGRRDGSPAGPWSRLPRSDDPMRRPRRPAPPAAEVPAERVDETHLPR